MLCSPLLLELLEVLLAEMPTAGRLDHGHDLGQTLITHLLKTTQDSSTEEHLRI